MKIVITNGSSVPLFEQIKNAIKENIMTGQLCDGEQLPSVRQMAKELKISILTVKKAYDELAAEGFIDVRHGLGTFVAENNSLLKLEEKQKKLEELLQASIQLSMELNLSQNDLGELLSYLYEGEHHGTKD